MQDYYAVSDKQSHVSKKSSYKASQVGSKRGSVSSIITKETTKPNLNIYFCIV